MKTKLIPTILLTLCINAIGFCQPITSEVTSNTLSIAENRDVFLNQAIINPAFLTDSEKININLILFNKVTGSIKKNNGVELKAESGKFMHNLSAGVNLDYRTYDLFDHFSVLGEVKKGIALGKFSKLDFGLNVGLMLSRMDISRFVFQQPEPLAEEKTDWTGYPIVDLGVAFQYKNQHLGLSYKNLVKTYMKFQLYDYELKQSGIIGSYQGDYNLFTKLTLIPEVYGCLTKDDSYAVIAGKVNYDNILTAGVLYNTNDSYGFLLDVTILKRITVGYFLNSEKEFNNQTYISHALNLGVIL